MSALRMLRDEDAPTYDERAEPEKPRFAMLHECVLFDERLTSSAIRLYAVLQRYAGEHGAHRMFPSHQELADYSHMNRDTVSSALSKLEECGHITRKARGFGEPKLIILEPPAPYQRDDKPRCGSSPRAEDSRSGKVPHTVRKSSATDAEKFRIPRRESNERESKKDGGEKKAPHPIPDDFVLTPQLLAFAMERGWNELRAMNEFERFAFRAREKGELAQTWDGKWRTWVLRGIGYDLRDGRQPAKPENKGFKPGTPEWAAATGKAVL